MSWNLNRYYTARKDGLLSKLKLDEGSKKGLERLRSIVRSRIREVFAEAQHLAQEGFQENFSLENLQEHLKQTKFQHLDSETRYELAGLLKDMDSDARDSFLKLRPRFWTQGSFQYDTINQPYFIPPQEMDIDDGTYLPMDVFEGTPVVGHRLLILLVDTALISLCHENHDWEFEQKKTCARIKIPEFNTHIDIPMYAIPKDEFLKKEEALEVNKRRHALDEVLSLSMESEPEISSLEPDSVNLALREGDQKWCKSDPKIVEDWFNDMCSDFGPSLRKLCRLMKAWRDAQWEKGGPSSIALMAAVVEVLKTTKIDEKDLGESMLSLTRKLPEVFKAGVESPDHTDEKPLFPPTPREPLFEQDVINKLSDLHKLLTFAKEAKSKDEAFNHLASVFGKRVTDRELIIRDESTPAFQHEPEKTEAPTKISTTMSSG